MLVFEPVEEAGEELDEQQKDEPHPNHAAHHAQDYDDDVGTLRAHCVTTNSMRIMMRLKLHTYVHHDEDVVRS